MIFGFLMYGLIPVCRSCVSRLSCDGCDIQRYLKEPPDSFRSLDRLCAAAFAHAGQQYSLFVAVAFTKK